MCERYRNRLWNWAIAIFVCVRYPKIGQIIRKSGYSAYKDNRGYWCDSRWGPRVGFREAWRAGRAAIGEARGFGGVARGARAFGGRGARGEPLTARRGLSGGVGHRPWGLGTRLGAGAVGGVRVRGGPTDRSD